MRSAPAVTLATATGTSERGRHSKSSSSTAMRMAAIGAAKVADIPAAAPATSNVVRSASDKPQPLRDERAECSAGHDDWTLGAERPAGPDGDRRGDGFQHRDPRLDACAAQQDGFDGFGNSVAANLVGTITRHQADDDAADDGDNQHSSVRLIRSGRADHGEAYAVIEEDVCRQRNRAEQQHCESRSAGADHNRDGGEEPCASIDGEVTQSGGPGSHRASAARERLE